MITRWFILFLILATQVIPVAAHPLAQALPMDPPFPGVAKEPEPGFWDLTAFAITGAVSGCWVLFVWWWNKRHPGPGEQK